MKKKPKKKCEHWRLWKGNVNHQPNDFVCGLLTHKGWKCRWSGNGSRCEASPDFKEQK